jgi:hypothetical protein
VAAFADGMDETGVLERADVVSDALPGKAQRAGDAGGGIGPAEKGEDPESDRIHDGSGLIR